MVSLGFLNQNHAGNAKQQLFINLSDNKQFFEVILLETGPKSINNAIEVNYFDTHLSEQGEQLYIYMNSRGEQLSFQEIVRAEMMKTIGTAAEKIQLGEDWEGWQNYFWQNRGENENADLGFEEFLKRLDAMSAKFNISFVITVSIDEAEAPDYMKKYA